MAGPVGIAQIVGDSYEQAEENYGTPYAILVMFEIVVLLSVNLGIMNLLPIPDLVSGDSDYAFYIASTGKKTGFLHRLHTNQKNAAMKEVRDQFITYMMEYGIPKEIDVEDQHLYQMLIQVCKDLKVKILWKAADPEILSEQFEEAMCEQNPISALDQRMLESLAHLSEAELLAYVEQQPDEKIKKILKQLLYMSLFRKE